LGTVGGGLGRLGASLASASASIAWMAMSSMVVDGAAPRGALHTKPPLTFEWNSEQPASGIRPSAAMMG
jgi:hypothetical protein